MTFSSWLNQPFSPSTRVTRWCAGSGGDGVPDLLRCCRQLGFADDFEFSGHGQSSVVRLVLGSGVFSAPGGWVMLGCRAVMRRCRRPPPALSSWYLAIRPSRAAPSSAAKAARSAAEANLISLSIAKVASSFRAAFAAELGAALE